MPQRGQHNLPFSTLKSEEPLKAYPAQIEVALIDFDCREQVDYMDRLMEVVRDVEQKFLDENRAALEAMKADATKEG
jgi:hypothetical protein